MLDSTLTAATDVVIEGAKQTLRAARPFFTTHDLRRQAYFGVCNGVADLTKIAVVTSGLVVAGGAVYGIVRTSSFLTNQSRKLARNLHERSSDVASKVFTEKKPAPEPKAETEGTKGKAKSSKESKIIDIEAEAE
jgi:hypothetical protein